jgi:spoIIIJ-associated protein
MPPSKATTADEDVEAEEDQEQADDAENLSEEERLALGRDTVEDFLRSILESFHLDEVNNLNVSVEDGRIMAKIEGEDCGILIGRKGATLRSLQYLTSLAANKVTKSRVRLTLDIGSYKEKRNSSVVDLAIRTAKRAVETGQAFELSPMSASERRVVHESLQGFEGITTYSEGEEPNRYVVIDLAYEDENFPDDEI